MIQDLRFAFRTLLKSPGPSTVAVLVLALGIGANTVVFSLVHGLVLEPLGFAAPERLVRFFGTDQARGSDRQRVPEATVTAARQQSGAFVQIGGAVNTGLSVTNAERPLNPLMRRVSEGWFEMLGVEPVIGRSFLAEEHTRDARVVMLHHAFWQSYFGGDDQIVGKTIELNDEPYEIVGVIGASFRNEAFPGPPVLWLPLQLTEEPDTARSNYVLIGRLAEGAGLAQARQEAERLSSELASVYPEAYGSRGLRLETLRDSLIERFEPALMVLFGAVGFVLLIACSNVAHLQLTRALGRTQEIAVRRALGAGRGHLARQLLTEGLLISFAGAGLGTLAAFWSIGPVAGLAPSNSQLRLLDRVDVEPQVMIFSLLLACLTTLIFGLLPLRQVFRDSAERLSASAKRLTAGRSRRRLRSTLVVTELALSMVLLVGAGLTVRSLQHLKGLGLGFEPAGLLVGRMGPRGSGFDAPDRWESFYLQATERIAALPGVDSVGAFTFAPTFAAGFGAAVAVAPESSDQTLENRPRAALMGTLPGTFATTGQRMFSGRDFNSHDTADSTPVAVLSRNLAYRLWGEDDPLGKMLQVGEGEGRQTTRVVGVAADLRGLADNPAPPTILYRPLAQAAPQNLSFFVRRGGASDEQLLAMVPAIEDAIWSLSRDAPVYGFTTMPQLVRDLEWQPRFLVQLLTCFALLALVLAATGVYSVLAYGVRERNREIGIRVTVGASRGDIVRMVGQEALKLSALGVGFGVLGALAASRVLESQLLGVSARDPWTYGALALGLTAVALLASYLPARAATRVDPVVALRSD